MSGKTAKRPKRPTRQRKADRQLHSGISAEEIRCDYALAPFDRLAAEMDRKKDWLEDNTIWSYKKQRDLYEQVASISEAKVVRLKPYQTNEYILETINGIIRTQSTLQ